MTEVLTYEALKAERDALERQLSMSEAKCRGYFSDAAAALVKCDELAVENAALKDVFGPGEAVVNFLSIALRHTKYDYIDLPDVALAFKMSLPETPATDAALSAIEARGVEKLIKLKMEQLASMHPDTHAFGATAESLRAQINELQAFATELREAK